MVIQAFIPAIGHLTRIGITSSSARSAAGTFAQSLPFGAGYSFGTYVGFPGNYKSKYDRTQTINLTPAKSNMYHNRNYRTGGRKFSFRRTSWFNKRVYNRKYRKYVFIHRRSYY